MSSRPLLYLPKSIINQDCTIFSKVLLLFHLESSKDMSKFILQCILWNDTKKNSDSFDRSVSLSVFNSLHALFFLLMRGWRFLYRADYVLTFAILYSVCILSNNKWLCISHVQRRSIKLVKGLVYRFHEEQWREVVLF